METSVWISKEKMYPDLRELDVQILFLLHELENRPEPANSTDVYANFLNGTTDVLERRLMHWKNEGYIRATVEPRPRSPSRITST